jgi:hypothetical protein
MGTLGEFPRKATPQLGIYLSLQTRLALPCLVLTSSCIGTMVKQGVCHTVALPFAFFKGKRRIMETQIFHHSKI